MQDDLLLAEADLFAKGSLLTGRQLFDDYKRFQQYYSTTPFHRYAALRLSVELLLQVANDRLTVAEIRGQLELLGIVPEPNKIRNVYDVYDLQDNFIWLYKDEFRLESKTFAYATKEDSLIVVKSIESDLARSFVFNGEINQGTRKGLADEIAAVPGVTLIKSLIQEHPQKKGINELVVVVSISNQRI